MIEAIENFLVSINPSFGVFAVSMVPIIELRGAIPLGIGSLRRILWDWARRARSPAVRLPNG